MNPTSSADATALAHELREELLPITFLCCVIGLWDTLWNQGTGVKTILGAIFRVLIVVILVWQYPVFIDSAREALSGFRNGVFSRAGENTFKQVLMANVQTQPGTLDFTGQICAALVHSLQGLGQVMLSILMFLQEFCLRGLIAISPILLGFLGWNLTRAMGVQFCFTTLGILMWEIGVLIVDVLLLSFGENYLRPTLEAGAIVGAAGAVTGVLSWPLFLSAVVIAALIPAFLYLSVPFIIATVLRGGDPTGPLLLKAMQMATAAPAAAAMLPKLSSAVAAAGSLGNVLRAGSAMVGSVTSGGIGGGSSDAPQAPQSEVAKPMPSAQIAPLASLGAPVPSSSSGSATLSSSGSGGNSSDSAAAQTGETYIGKRGHIFKQLTPTEFSCQHPRTRFTSQHEGNIGFREVADNALVRHNMKRMSAGDMTPQGQRKSKSK